MPTRFTALLLFLLILCHCPTLFAATPEAAVKELSARGGKVKINKFGEVIELDLAKADVGLDQLELLSAFPELNRLTLWGATVTDAAIPLLAKTPNSKHSSLKIPRLPARGFTHSANSPISRFSTSAAVPIWMILRWRPSAQMQDLEQLILLYNNFSDVGLAHLAKLKKLKVLDLRGCTMVSSEGLRPLAALPNLQRLKLRCPAVDDTGVEILAEFPKLRGLWLEDCSVTDDGALHLARHTKLDELYLFRTYISDDALAALAPMVRLKRLSLRDTAISGSTLNNLTASADTLINLDLSETQTDDAGMSNLANLKKLERLNLWNTQIEDAGLAQLKDLTNLRWLNLQNTGMTDVGTAALLPLQNIESLNLSETAVSDQGLAMLAGLRKLKNSTLPSHR